MSRALIIINTNADREKLCAWARKAPWNTRVEWKAPKRTLDQNSRFWAMLTDVASQVQHAGQRYNTEEWKLLFMHAWGREVRFIPALDLKSIVPVGQSSSDLTKEEMGDLMEFMSAWGTEHGVNFHDPHEHEPSDAPNPLASDAGRDAPYPIPGVAATHSEGELDSGNGAGSPDDSVSVGESTSDTGATPSAEEAEPVAGASDGAVLVPAAEHECIRKLLGVVADYSVSPKDRAKILAESANLWLSALGDERKAFVTEVFKTAKKVLRNELPADKAKVYLEGLAA